MSFSLPKVPQVEHQANYPSTFEDSGYDTSTTHIDDDDDDDVDDDVAGRGVGQWAEQLSTARTEVTLPSADDIFYEQDGSCDSDKHEDFLSKLGRRKWPLGICTMPRLNLKNNLPKLHPRPSLKAFYSGSSGKPSSGSLRSPDRFLSSVDYQDSSVHKFRINKDPQKLSPSEKLIRHDSASMDAFSPRRSFTTPTPPAGAATRRNSGSIRPGGMASELSWASLADNFQNRALSPSDVIRMLATGSVRYVGTEVCLDDIDTQPSLTDLQK